MNRARFMTYAAAVLSPDLLEGGSSDIVGDLAPPGNKTARQSTSAGQTLHFFNEAAREFFLWGGQPDYCVSV